MGASAIMRVPVHQSPPASSAPNGLWRGLDRAITLVEAYEASLSDALLRGFWMDMGLRD